MNLTGYNEDKIFSSIDECPRCKSRGAKVLDSRMDNTNCLRIRRKSCLICRFSWKTVEILESDFECSAELSVTRDLSNLRKITNNLKLVLNRLENNVSDNMIQVVEELTESLSNTVNTIEDKYSDKAKALLNYYDN